MYLAIAATSLSPLPDRQTIMFSSAEYSFATFKAYATAWALSIAGIIPSVRESRPNAVYALLRGYEYYSACHNNFSQLSIMLRSTLGG